MIFEHARKIFYTSLNRLSSKKKREPIKISQVAKELGISPQAVYKWLKGEMSSPKLAGYIKSAYGIMLSARLNSQEQCKARELFIKVHRSDNR